MHSFSIRFRLILLFLLQILILILIGGVYLDWQLRQTLEKELADKLESLAKAAALQIEGELILNLLPGDEETRTYRNLLTQVQDFRRNTGVRRIYIFSKNKTSIIDTKADIAIGTEYVFLPISEDEIDILFSGKAVNSTLFEGSDGRLYKTGFASVSAHGSVIAGLAVEGSAQTLEAIQTVRRDLLVLGAIVLAGSVILGFVFSKTITGPINRLKTSAQRIAKGDYESEINIEAKDEIGFLEQTMEEMRRAIVQRDTRQKAMLAGVAHEIRNPLGGIELFAGLLASELTDKKAKQEAQKIRKEVQNLKKIVNDFLSYARPTKPKKEHCYIKEVFDEVSMLLATELNGIKVDFREETSKTQAWIDPQHLKQIFLNLMKNSIEALNGAGTIRLETKQKENSVQLIFSDTGPGIDTVARQQIFEPFFTNRKEGTGLGLAIVKSLVEENGGHISLVEEKGASFEIVLQK